MQHYYVTQYTPTAIFSSPKLIGVALPPSGDIPLLYLSLQHCIYHVLETYILTKCAIKLHIKI